MICITITPTPPALHAGLLLLSSAAPSESGFEPYDAWSGSELFVNKGIQWARVPPALARPSKGIIILLNYWQSPSPALSPPAACLGRLLPAVATMHLICHCYISLEKPLRMVPHSNENGINATRGRVSVSESTGDAVGRQCLRSEERS